MKYWFIVLSEEAFGKNSNFIGIGKKRDYIIIPKNATLINNGDKIIYYIKFLHKIVGVFEVQKTLKVIWEDKPVHFRIKRISKDNKTINIKEIISNLELFSHLSDIHSKWGASIQGISNSVKPLSENDYKLILKSLS